MKKSLVFSVLIICIMISDASSQLAFEKDEYANRRKKLAKADDVTGIRIEDTVVITEDGCEILSSGLPRTVEEIEAFMKNN